MQVCSLCGVKKPISEFYKNRGKPRKDCKVCHEKSKMKYRVGRYGITVSEFYSLIEQQNNKCAICEETFEKTRTRHIDHCHTSGKVRGMLCHGCNTAIGLMKESPEILKAALKYLQK